MNVCEPRVVLNPIQTLLDDGCPQYQGVDDLPVFVSDDPVLFGDIDDDALSTDAE